jgi:ribosomal protein S14
MREHLKKRDQIRRLLSTTFEIQRIILQSIIHNRNLRLISRYAALYNLQKLKTNTSFTKIRNRCVFSGRSKGVYRFCKLSRIAFRSLASGGFLAGIKKASW